MNSLPKTMKAAVVEGIGKIVIREFPLPEPLPGEIIVKIENCLLCTWEQRIFNGAAKMDLPFIPGHEASGIVAAVPDSTVTSFNIGDKIVIKTLDSCGHCEACYKGDDNLCTGKPRKRFYNGIPGSGGLAQYISLPVSRVFLLPDQSTDLRLAAFAEPLACCIHSIEQSGIELGEDVVVVGAGIMGQFHIALAKKRGARVLVVEPDKKRAELALKTGASRVIDPNAADSVNEILTATQQNGAHVVFLTTTQAELAQEYIGAIKKRGRIVYYGSFHPDKDISVNPNKIHYTEKLITGSYSPTTKAFWTAARLISYNIIDVSPFLTKEFILNEAQEAFEASQIKDNFRILIKL